MLVVNEICFESALAASVKIVFGTTVTEFACISAEVYVGIPYDVGISICKRLKTRVFEVGVYTICRRDDVLTVGLNQEN